MIMIVNIIFVSSATATEILMWDTAWNQLFPYLIQVPIHSLHKCETELDQAEVQYN